MYRILLVFFANTRCTLFTYTGSIAQDREMNILPYAHKWYRDTHLPFSAQLTELFI